MRELIEQFNKLSVVGMPTLTKLYGCKGDKINIECIFPNGESGKIFDDGKMYYMSELKNENSDGTFLLVTDKIQLAVIECHCTDNRLLIWKRI